MGVIIVLILITLVFSVIVGILKIIGFFFLWIITYIGFTIHRVFFEKPKKKPMTY